MKLIKTTIIVLIAHLSLVTISAQGVQNQSPEDPQRRANNNVIKVKLTDSLTKAPIEFATISVTPKGASEALKYTLSDDKGVAEIKGVPFGEYKVKAELLGYSVVERDVVIKEVMTDVGTLIMKEEATFLEGATISARGNPILVKKDTIEYNAASYKITDNDMLEELLKKLPGMEIDSDGKITHNGKEITKITIDGKTFFLDDPQLATKNIPAKLVNKVKVVDRKSDQAQFTGIDDGQEETVIDLSIQPGMLRGWFGNVSGGYGTEDRYQTAGMLGRFTDLSQFSLIVNGNNTNNRGFSDMQGDMMRGMRGGGMQISGGGGMFGGNGITTSWMAGVNANTTVANDKLKIGGSYMYTNTETEALRNTDTRRLFKESNDRFETSEVTSINSNEGHRIGGELDWKISDNTSILFRPRVNFGYGSYNEKNVFSTDLIGDDNIHTKMTDGQSLSYGDNESFSTNGMILFRQRLGKPGRTLSLNVDYSISQNELLGFNKNNTNSYDQTGSFLSETVLDQYLSQREESYSVAGRLSYTEPLGKNFYAEASYRYSYRSSTSLKETFNYNSITGKYDDFDELYSNNFENLFINQDATLNIMKQEEKYNVQLGFSAQPAYTKSFGEGGSARNYENSVVNYAPMARVDLRFSNSNVLRINYRGSTNQPSINQLQPVLDNSNPLRITLGNPDLVPEFSNRFSVDYRVTNTKTFASFNLGANMSYTKDKIVNASWTNLQNVTYTAPINSDGVMNGSLMFFFNLPIGNTNLSINSFSNVGYSKGVSYSIESEAENFEDVIDELLRNKNNTNTLSASENLTLSYRNDMVEARLSGNARYSNAWYTIKKNEQSATWTNSLNASVNLTLPAGINIVTDARYTTYIGYAEGYNEPQLVWNAEISKLLFKDKATLRIKMYDILKQAKNTYHMDTDNYIMDVTNNTLGQYIMLSFTYRFGTFQNQNRMGPGPRHGGGPMMMRR